MNFFHKYRARIFVVALALTLRLIFFFWAHPFGPGGDAKLLVNDASGYHNIAVSLIQHGSYPPHDDYQSMLRTIGYPAFIAAIYAPFGIRPWLVILLQIILDSLFALLLMRIARLFNLKKGLWLAGFLWAVDPLAIISANALLSDSLYVWLTLAGFYFLTRYFLQGRIRDLYLNAVLLALAAHVRPVGLYLFFVLALVLLIKAIREKTLSRWLRYTLLFVLLIAPWLIRNKALHNHFFFSISGDYNALILYAGPLYAALYGIDKNRVKDVLENNMARRYPRLKENDPFLFYQKYRDEGLALIMGHPFKFTKQVLLKSLRMFLGTDRETVMGLLSGAKRPKVMDTLLNNGFIPLLKSLSAGDIIYLVVVESLLLAEYLLCVCGLRLVYKKYSVWVVLGLLAPIVYFAVMGMPMGFTRFKLPLMPFYIFLAAVGVYHLLIMNYKTPKML